MDISKLSRGPNPPWDVNVLIEIPQGSTEPVKYEFDKASGAMMVDRFRTIRPTTASFPIRCRTTAIRSTCW